MYMCVFVCKEVGEGAVARACCQGAVDRSPCMARLTANHMSRPALWIPITHTASLPSALSQPRMAQTGRERELAKWKGLLPSRILSGIKPWPPLMCPTQKPLIGRVREGGREGGCQIIPASELLFPRPGEPCIECWVVEIGGNPRGTMHHSQLAEGENTATWPVCKFGEFIETICE